VNTEVPALLGLASHGEKMTVNKRTQHTGNRHRVLALHTTSRRKNRMGQEPAALTRVSGGLYEQVQPERSWRR
jgi:hypothetical protein